MQTLQQLFSEYGESHQNETNKIIHWICVPSIFFSITGLLYSVSLPFCIGDHRFNLAIPLMLLLMVYYFLLSKTLWIGMFLFATACLFVCHLVKALHILPLWQFSLIIFVLAWIGQFYGHKIEGKKPSFLKDLQFLLIGPAWLMGFIYQRLGINL